MGGWLGLPRGLRCVRWAGHVWRAAVFCGVEVSSRADWAAPAGETGAGSDQRVPLRLLTQTKLDAAFTSPLPTYFGQPGYSHSGRVRPGTSTLSATTCRRGARPCSTQSSSAVSESQE